ncbi:3'-5' exonuclease [Mesorhizobium sp. IMUNJ 23232]|uniref:3'-5' exonuclease n=1 Tax=Mesorhizobium sp. IMUNJ 23232 TaxID=3376064 RepID=UPI0037968FC1
MTVHRIKGLEFGTVIVLGPEEQTFWDNANAERRAFFVACSRAKERLVLATCSSRIRPPGARNWFVNRVPGLCRIPTQRSSAHSPLNALLDGTSEYFRGIESKVRFRNHYMCLYDRDAAQRWHSCGGTLEEGCNAASTQTTAMKPPESIALTTTARRPCTLPLAGRGLSVHPCEDPGRDRRRVMRSRRHGP